MDGDMDGSRIAYPKRTNVDKVPNGRFDNANEIIKRKLEREKRQEQTRRRVGK